MFLNSRRHLTAGVATGVLLGVLAGCRGEPGADQVSGEVIAVTVQPVRLGPIRDVVRAGGVIAPIPAGDFIVAAAEPAEITEITKNEGDAVAAGDVLVRLEIAALAGEQATRQLEVTDAITKYEAAKAEEARLSKLFSQGFVARNQWEATRTTLVAAESALNQARDRLDALKSMDASGSSAKLITFDLNQEVAQSIQDKKIEFSIDQQPYVQGFMAVQSLWAYLSNGNDIGGGLPVLTGPSFVDAENIEQILPYAKNNTR